MTYLLINYFAIGFIFTFWNYLQKGNDHLDGIVFKVIVLIGVVLLWPIALKGEDDKESEVYFWTYDYD